MNWDKTLQIDPAIAAQLDPDRLIQVVYVHLDCGRQFVFLGPPMTDEELEEIKQVTFGERITSVMLYSTKGIH